MIKNEGSIKGYDIIGDIHGYAGALKALLKKLGYSGQSGVWSHPERHAIFVGDLIDRGPEQKETCRIVRAMVDNGFASCIMGNHEYNALTHYLGCRKLKGLRDPHQSFLDQIPAGSAEYEDLMAWFKTLPLWLEFDDFAVIHACFDPKAMENLKFCLNENHAFAADDFIRLSKVGKEQPGTRGRKAYEAVETLLKGPEIKLPDGCGFPDAAGETRTEMRIRWWDGSAETYRDLAFAYDTSIFPETPLPKEIPVVEPQKFIFIGHYWLNVKCRTEPLCDKVVCTDYSVAKGGPLTAYRYTVGDRSLSAANFVAVYPPFKTNP